MKHKAHPLRRVRSLLPACLAVAALLTVPPAAESQGVSLEGWARNVWLRLQDQSAATDGRLGSSGILRRYRPVMDNEYTIDLMSTRFTLRDDYLWYQRENGARYWTGSINARFLTSGLDIKTRIPLGGQWSGVVRFEKENTLEIARNLLSLDAGRQWASGPYAGAQGTFDPEKPNMDLEFQLGWKRPDRRVIIGLGIVDAYNDVVYQVLKVWEEYADTALDYEEQPLTARIGLRWPIGGKLRIEAHGALLKPSLIRAYRQLAPDSGFHQRERFRYAGALLEWTPHRLLQLSGYATHERAHTDRQPLVSGTSASSDYELSEQTTGFGAFSVLQVGSRVSLEGWIHREARPERRTRRAGTGEVTEYEERAWRGLARLQYTARGQFRCGAMFVYDVREIARQRGPPPVLYSRSKTNLRLVLDVGWELNRRADFRIGYRVDLDGDPGEEKQRQMRFDGLQAKFNARW